MPLVRPVPHHIRLHARPFQARLNRVEFFPPAFRRADVAITHSARNVFELVHQAGCSFAFGKKKIARHAGH